MSMVINPSIIEAVEALNYRVTPGDVSRQAGLDVRRVEQDLVALAVEVGGHLQVEGSGNIAYQFPKNLRAILRNKSLRLRLQEWCQHVWRILFYLIRISFGIILIASIAVLAVTVITMVVIVIQGDKKRSDRDRNSSPSSWEQVSGSLNSTLFQGWQLARLFSLFADMFLNVSYQRPIYHQFSDRTLSLQSKHAPTQQSHNLNFLEAVFSFLFGDGDPNVDLEETRWQMVGTIIYNHQGAIAAEQVLPYLDEPPEGWTQNDEDYMLPVLTRFNGRPSVSPIGQLVYYFPDLQITAGESYNRPVPDYLEEKLWSFSQASQGQIVGAIALGIINISLILLVGYYAFSESLSEALREVGLGLVLWLYPMLLAYGIGFLGIPAIRYFWIKQRNQRLINRNQRRQAQAYILETASSEIQEKLTYAQQFSAKIVIDRDDVIYTTESDLIDQELPNQN